MNVILMFIAYFAIILILRVICFLELDDTYSFHANNS